jgi:very-short-patch-repair endonuclease
MIQRDCRLWITTGWAAGISQNLIMNWFATARRQNGVVSHSQLVAAGLSHGEMDGMVRRGELKPLYPGTYLHGSLVPTYPQRLWAASLWADSGIVSHQSAARLLMLPVELPTTVIHLTVDDRRYRRTPTDIDLHRVRVGPSEITTVRGLRVTTRVRSLVDLCRAEPPPAARNLADRAMQLGWIEPSDLARSVAKHPGRTGNTQLRAILAGLEPGAHAESERVFHRLLRTAGIRGWRAQHRVRVGARSCLIDVAFPEQRLAIEIDGRRYHDELSDRFEDDRARQNALVGDGWRVLRFTWRQLTERPDWVLGQVRRLLAA